MFKKLWDSIKYKKILSEVGDGRYQIFSPEDPFISSYLSPGLAKKHEDKFTCVCLATCATIVTSTIDYACEGVIIPKCSPVVLWRTFRYCEHDGVPHLNADDNIIFPDQKGSIWKVSKTDSEDHYISIATWAGLNVIASAYHLPQVPSGAYSDYVENGASVPITFVPVGNNK
ncbi:MAG: hypothetical protein KJ593_03420 [Candidatus Omnitrophica bacterium]|nr:hypothetical protein [Candidatus Omnitrophota bacterium]